jgi:hypothetical protein
MQNAPSTYTFERLAKITNGNCQAGINGKWYPARPCGFYSWGNRIKTAWLVFTGRADALIWPGGQ